MNGQMAGTGPAARKRVSRPGAPHRLTPIHPESAPLMSDRNNLPGESMTDRPETLGEYDQFNGASSVSSLSFGKKKKTILVVKNQKDTAKKSKKKTVLVARRVKAEELETVAKTGIVTVTKAKLSTNTPGQPTATGEGIRYNAEGKLLEHSILGTAKDFEHVDRLLAAQEDAKKEATDGFLTPGSMTNSQSSIGTMPSPGGSLRQGTSASGSRSTVSRKGRKLQRAASRVRTVLILSPEEERAQYLDNLRKAIANSRRVREIQRKREASLVRQLPTNEKFSLSRDSAIIENWKNRQREWERLNKALALKSGKRETDTVMVKSEAYREKIEELSAIQAAIPVYEKYPGAFWELGLRNHGQRYAMVGNLFSGLFCPLREDRPIEYLVRRPGMKMAGPSLVLTDTGEMRPMKTWKDSPYLHHKKRTLEKRIATCNPVPQVLNADLMEGLIVRGQNLLEWAYRSSSEYFENLRLDALDASMVESLASLSLSERSSVQSSSVNRGAQLVLEGLQFLAMTTPVRLSSTTTVTLRNTGSAALYYQWIRSPEQPNVVTDTIVRHDQNAFQCEAAEGLVLPGDRITIWFSFFAEDPGLFSDQWELSTTPGAHFAVTETSGGVETPVEKVTVSLRGTATLPDVEAHLRRKLESKVESTIMQHKMESLVWDVFRDVKTPVRESAVRAAQKQRFEQKNEAQALWYSPRGYDELNLLYRTCVDQVSDQFTTLGKFVPLLQKEWDEVAASVSTVAELLWGFWDPSLKNFNSDDVSKPVMERALAVGRHTDVKVKMYCGSVPGELLVVDCTIPGKKPKKTRITLTNQALMLLLADSQIDTDKLASYENRRLLAALVLTKFSAATKKPFIRLQGLEPESNVYSEIKDHKHKKKKKAKQESDQEEASDEEEDEEDDQEELAQEQKPAAAESFGTSLCRQALAAVAMCELRPLLPLEVPTRSLLSQHLANAVVDSVFAAKEAAGLPVDTQVLPMESEFLSEEASRKWKLILADRPQEEESKKDPKATKGKGGANDLLWEKQPEQMYRKMAYKHLHSKLGDLVSDIVPEALACDSLSLEAHRIEKGLPLSDRAVLRDGTGLIGVRKASTLASGFSEDVHGKTVLLQLNLNFPDIAHSNNINYPEGSSEPGVKRAANVITRIKAGQPAAIILIADVDVAQAFNKKTRSMSIFDGVGPKSLTFKPFEKLLSDLVGTKVRYCESLADLHKHMKKKAEMIFLLEYFSSGKLLPPPKPEPDTTPNEEEVLFNFGLDEEENAQHLEALRKQMDVGLALSKVVDVFVQDDAEAVLLPALSLNSLSPQTGQKIAGPHLHLEMNALGYLLERPKRSFLAMVGGAGLKNRVALIGNLLDHVDVLALGGGLAVTFLKALGKHVGMFDTQKVPTRDPLHMLPVARTLLSKAYRRGVKIVLPTDFVVADQPVNIRTLPDYGVLPCSLGPCKPPSSPAVLAQTKGGGKDFFAVLSAVEEERSRRQNSVFSETDSVASSNADRDDENSDRAMQSRDSIHMVLPSPMPHNKLPLQMVSEELDNKSDYAGDSSDRDDTDRADPDHGWLTEGLISYSNELPSGVDQGGSAGVDFEGETKECAVEPDGIPPKWIAYDLGPQSISAIKEEIKGSKTILWDGLMGACEVAAFQTATRELLEAVVSAHRQAADQEENATISTAGGEEEEDGLGGNAEATNEKPAEAAVPEEEMGLQKESDSMKVIFAGNSTTLWVKKIMREDEEDKLVPGQGFSHFSTNSRLAQMVLSGKPVSGIKDLSRRTPLDEELLLLEDVLKLKEKSADVEEESQEGEESLESADQDEDEDEEDDEDDSEDEEDDDSNQ